ncbi:4-O-dimethylallyl-L-tyrosine synthase [Paramyrothecium foliicola]|nr:4-O-dimethylallyl-L-tyrosine synthase [Paramyrothecium foliicola]
MSYVSTQTSSREEFTFEREGSLRLLNPNGSAWNDEVGSMLTEMLTMAGYAKHSTRLHAEFFRTAIASSLGFHPEATKAPQTWKSFMTDDNTPVEVSWAWGNSAVLPKVRYSVEPISTWAAQGVDLINTAANARLLAESLNVSRDMDLYLHGHFQSLLTSQDWTQDNQDLCGPEVPQSQVFAAFDLMENEATVKQYYIPGRRAATEGTSNWEVVKESIRKLPAPAAPLLTSFDCFVDFLESFPAESQPTVEILAIDCLCPTKSRLKIYVRSRETSLRSCLDMLALNGRAPKSAEEDDALRELWHSVFGLDPETYNENDELPEKKARTGGLLFYYELKANGKIPKSKVYLPVRHYAQNDDQVARGVSDFLEKRGKKLTTGSYYDSLKKLCKHRDLSDGLGYHSYVSWACDKGKWNVTAYLNPEIYDRRRVV